MKERNIIYFLSIALIIITTLFTCEKTKDPIIIDKIVKDTINQVDSFVIIEHSLVRQTDTIVDTLLDIVNIPIYLKDTVIYIDTLYKIPDILKDEYFNINDLLKYRENLGSYKDDKIKINYNITTFGYLSDFNFDYEIQKYDVIQSNKKDDIVSFYLGTEYVSNNGLFFSGDLRYNGFLFSFGKDLTSRNFKIGIKRKLF